ncbi:MAG: hypothetical protein J6R40_03500, partial [Clostridia bacterium]|nr:hypothetical protein [Clostridia bacterium]
MKEKSTKNEKTPIKISKYLHIICFLGLLLWFFALPANAQENVLSDYLAKLKEATPPSLAHKVDFESTDAVLKKTGLSYVLESVRESANAALPRAAGFFVSFCGLALLGSLALQLCEKNEKSGHKDMVEKVACAALALCVFRAAQPCLENALQTLKDIEAFYGAMLPVTGALYVAGGNSATAAAAGASGSLVLSVCQLLSGSVLSPLLAASASLSLVGAISKSGDGYGIGEQVKRLFSTLLGAFVTIASASLALQCAVGSAADSAALRGARYAVAQAIPMVGNAVSASLGTVGASVSLIKSTLGGGAVLILGLCVLPVIIELYLMKFGLSLAAILAGMV